jgi:hypothetical protein
LRPCGRGGILRSPRGRGEEFTEALIVAILAVLPLRAVLVPAEIAGLTRVDLVLGIGLVLIVGVAVGKYATEIWEASDGSAPYHRQERLEGTGPAAHEA